MLNHIASSLLGFLLITRLFQMPGRTDPISPQVEWTATLPRIADSRLHLGFVLALLAAAFVWWLLERTTLGFQIRAVGHNPFAAETAGMSVSRVTIVSMAIAGGLAGLGGVQMVLAPTLLTGFPPQLSDGIVSTLGFDAITVALLGRSRPLGVVAAGLLFGAMKAGGLTMSAQAQTPSELTAVIQALIVLFVAAPTFITWLVPALRERRTRKPARDNSKKEVAA
jgi:general nucleoside transport system permease protein